MKKWLAFVLALCLLTLGLCACEKDAYRTDLTSGEVMERVLAAIPQEKGYRQVSEQYISSSTWGADYQKLLDKVVDYHIVVAHDADMNVNEMGVFHVKESEDMAPLAAIVEAFVIGQVMRYEDLLESYNPGEMPKLDEAQVKVCGTYIFYSILTQEATERAQDAFEDALTVA